MLILRPSLVLVQKTKPIADSDLAAITARGRMLAEYDVASWYATDAVVAMKPAQGVVGRYIAGNSDGHWIVVFGRFSETKDAFLIVSETMQGNSPIPELEHAVTSRKQTVETCSNRQKLRKRLRPIFKSASFLSARDFASPASRNVVLPRPRNGPHSEGSRGASIRFWAKSRSYRKQTIKPFLPGATTAYKETASSSNFQISASVLSYKLQHHREGMRTPSQSSNLSRPYGRP